MSFVLSAALMATVFSATAIFEPAWRFKVENQGWSCLAKWESLLENQALNSLFAQLRTVPVDLTIEEVQSSIDANIFTKKDVLKHYEECSNQNQWSFATLVTWLDSSEQAEPRCTMKMFDKEIKLLIAAKIITEQESIEELEWQMLTQEILLIACRMVDGMLFVVRHSLLADIVRLVAYVLVYIGVWFIIIVSTLIAILYIFDVELRQTERY